MEQHHVKRFLESGIAGVLLESHLKAKKIAMNHVLVAARHSAGTNTWTWVTAALQLPIETEELSGLGRCAQVLISTDRETFEDKIYTAYQSASRQFFPGYWIIVS